jgi:hypothetical protein
MSGLVAVASKLAGSWGHSERAPLRWIEDYAQVTPPLQSWHAGPNEQLPAEPEPADQDQWLTGLPLKPGSKAPPSASDIIRYALTSLQERLPEAKLRETVIKHVHNEAKLYPGRARRRLPPDSSSDAAKS